MFKKKPHPSSIKDEKLQYDLNGEATKVFALSSGRINKYG